MEKVPYTKFKVNVTQTLSKEVYITTDEYTFKRTFNESLNRNVEVPDTSNTNWERLYKQEHWYIEDLLKELRQYIILDIKHHITNKTMGRLTALLSMCDGWNNVSTKITKK